MTISESLADRVAGSERSNRLSLRRDLGLSTAIALVVANTVGSGIFTVSGFIARDLGSATWLLALWIVGGLIEVVAALSYSELSAAMPQAGGEYVYLREAYGSLVGYLSGWTSFFVGFSGGIAAATLAFVGYLHHFIPMVDLAGPKGKLVAIAILFVLTGVHVVPVRFGGLLQRVLTLGALAAMAALIGAGFAYGRGSFGNFSSFVPAQGNAGVSLIFVLYAYSGWNAAAYIAGEVREPQRNLPRALLLGIAIVIALYLAMNLIYIYALPLPAMAGVLTIAEKASVALFGPLAAQFITALLALTILNSASAMVLEGPRVYYAMARDGVFPQALGHLSPMFGTPVRAVLLQGAWSAILILFFGTFEKVVVYTGFAVTIFTGLSVASLIVLRHQRPELHRPFRIPGSPFLPIAYLLVLAWVVGYTVIGRPWEALVSLGVVMLGLPWYFFWKGLQSTRPEQRSSHLT